MRITVIGPTSPYRGGISHYNTVLCNELKKTHEVQAISFTRLYPKMLFPGADQRDPNSKEKIECESTEIIDSINPLTWIKAADKIKATNPDLVIMYWWTPYFTFNFRTLSTLIKQKTNAKILFICHNVSPHDARLVDKILTKHALKNADYFIVHAKEEKENLLKLIPNAKVTQHVHPIYDIFKEKYQKKEDLTKTLNLRKKVILFFGFVRKYKGLKYLIRAMPKLIEKYPDLDLLIVGEFWNDGLEDKEELLNSPVKDNIKLIDYYVPNENVGNYFEASDICVLPYITATNSGIVQTAFGFDKPVIVTKVGGLPEVVEHNKTGLVIESENSDAIIEAVIDFYDNKKDFTKNIQQEKDRFSWSKMIEVIENLN
jgi:glycosyltransferase involved in cell wall biosynthesis